MHVLVVAGGCEENPHAIIPKLGSYSFVVAADGGYRLALKLGLHCDHLVGDFDTLSTEEVGRAEQSGIIVERHSADKDQSDLELALAVALRNGATCVTLLGALGGAWDHCLVNLLSPLTYLAEQNVWGRLLTSEAEIYLCDQPVKVAAAGRRVTLQALSRKVQGLTLEGFAYPLQQATLARSQTLGLANQAVNESASISVESGELLLAVLCEPCDEVLL